MILIIGFCCKPLKEDPFQGLTSKIIWAVGATPIVFPGVAVSQPNDRSRAVTQNLLLYGDFPR